LESAKSSARFDGVPKTVITDAARALVDGLRKSILSGGAELPEVSFADEALLERMEERVQSAMAYHLVQCVNATGVIVHTNLGRSMLADEAAEHALSAASRYSNLEYDLTKGRRGSRHSIVEKILCEISGAEAGMAVNNNAGAVLLCLDTIARGREVIVSRGELVEIGGSFRIPDVMAKSGCILKEVGATNRTHAADYENAINAETGLLLKAHTSNYSIVGFTTAVSLKDMVALGGQYQLPVMEDLGSGTFIDFSKYGLFKEPTVQESVAAGVDIVTFSGDKLLGGPQAGIIVGKRQILDRIKQNPLARALRLDKMTLAALESTMRLYRDEEEAMARIPTLRMIARRKSEIERQARRLAEMLEKIGGGKLAVRLVDLSSKAGGGSLPDLDLPSKGVSVRADGFSANRVEAHLRGHKPPVIGRIEEDRYILDLRSVQEDETSIIQDAFSSLLQKAPS